MLEITEPSYPLAKETFIRALKTGHGRALIQAEKHGTEGLREDILDAALFSKVYDSQCEGKGEAWLARLCESAGLVETIISRGDGAGDEDGGLRCALLKEFFLRGYEAALPALREMCRFDEQRNDLLGCAEIVEIEGADGFIFAADRLGQRLLEDKEFWVCSWLMSELDDRDGEGSAMAILDRESPANPNIAAYREAVLEDLERPKSVPDSTPPPVDDLIRLILCSSKREHRLFRYGRTASSEDRRKVAALDFSEMGPVQLENYLWFFQRNGLPEFREDHLPLLLHPEDRVKWRAHRVLSLHAEPQVRTAAYEALSRGEVGFFAELLRRSGLEEDVEPLLRAINSPALLADDDEIHGVGTALLDLARENDRMADPRIPLWIYEHGPCRMCRLDAVKVMIKRSTLPRWIAVECLSDAYEETRKVAVKYLDVVREF
ncbi:hypothetical protein OKA04_07905 [Luteolibacter flavescens]|uniref:HEAT repeat domain-containing protein n=1 Tax=Luteolibacter flavescens TaxID=1859460 RepID=A0ABT3FM55_9BACT|nr:hypothetical protein [Luteolibacter flavescens]MCW1884651.1 hypothetical protein [Luteolibacter flavescens]